MNRSSSLRLLAGLVVVAGMSFSRPSSAEVTSVGLSPDGVVGEGGPMFAAPDGRTGAMTESVPIELPRARGLPQPRLALQYNSSSTDREAGYGWGLDLPVIERRPLSGFPEFDVNGEPVGPERYAFNGKLLVRICQVPSCPNEPNTAGHPTWANGWWYYRLQVDGSTTRFYRSDDRMTWRMLRPGGEMLELGRHLDEAQAFNLLPAFERDTASSGIVRWRLAAQKDPQHPKNFIVYRWGKGLRTLLYLEDIYYTPAVDDVTSLSSFAHHVQLEWEDLPYIAAKYLSPERAPIEQRLKRIAVASMPWTSTTRELVRSYQLRYLANRTEPYDPATMAPLFHHSFMREVQMQGRCRAGVAEDGNGRIPDAECPPLPPMRFEYSPGAVTFRQSPAGAALEGAWEAPIASKPNVYGPFPQSMFLVDFDRDGLPDIVQGWEPGCIPAGNPDDHPVTANGMKIAITPEGDPELWCRTQYYNSEELQYRVRSARPIIGYLNRGPTASGPLSLRQTCMDAGNGTAGTIPWINDGTQNNEFVHFLVPGGSTVLAAAGDAVGFWQKDGYFPIVARPLTQPSFPPGGEPSNAAMGGCFLDDRFDKNNFFPRWSWEAGNNGTDFVYTTPGAPADWADASPNEPAWIVDVDGDGLPDKLIRDTVHTWDLYDAQISFARYLQRGEPLPLGSTGGAASGGALLGTTLPRTVAGAIVPSKSLRFNKDDLYPQHDGVPTKFWYADVNGDGIQDFITSTEFDGVPLVPRVRPGNGRGRFECTVEGQPGTVPCTDGADAPDYYAINVASASKPWVVAEWTPSNSLLQPRLFAPWYFTDVTGDGLADIVLQRTAGSGSPYVDVYVWVNVDGHTFDCLNLSTEPCQVARLNVGGDTSSMVQHLAFADMNGDGVNDIVSITNGVYVVSLYDQNTTSWATRAPRPGLLTRIDNGRGATTRVRYESIQELDLAAANTEKPWAFHSPAQANVVTEVRVDDTQSVDVGTALPEPFSLVRRTYFEYRDPAYDRWKRQFVGFRSFVASRIGEDAVTETTYWYGPCERDGVMPRALGGPVPSTGRCAGGSDDEREDTFLSRVGKPVRIDRYIPNSRTQSGDRYLWSKEIRYGDANWLFWPPQTDHVVVSSFVAEVKMHVYNDALGVSPGATETVATEADVIHHSPVQGGAKTTRTQYYTLPESGQVYVVIDYGDEAGGDMPVTTERYAIAERSWQYLPSSVPVHFDEDGSGNFSTTARDNWFEYDANGDLVAIEADPGPDFDLDRRHAAGLATAPTPVHSAWWSRLSELHYDAETGVVDEIRGAPWTANPASPQSCTKLVLDVRYREFPTEIKQFKNGCDSPDPLVTVLSFDRAFGVPVTKTAPDGGMSSVELDAFGRTIGVALPDPSSTAFPETVMSVEYGDQAPASYVDVRHYTSTSPTTQSVRQVALFNGLGEPVVSFSKDEGTTWIASSWTKRDVVGRIQQVRRPFATTQDPIALASSPLALPEAAGAGYFELDHDGFGRESAVRENGTVVLQRTFDRFSVETRDQEQLPGGAHDGASHLAIFDGRGNVKASIDGTTGVFGAVETAIAYDGLGQPLAITKSYGGNVGYTRTMTWDRLGRLVANNEPNTSRDGHHWRYAYDDAGRLVGTSDARGCGKNIHYDGLGRVVGEDYSPCLGSQPGYTSPTSPGGLEVEYEYDAYEPGQVSPEPGFNDAPEFAQGRLIGVRDRGSHTRFNYDARGRVRRTSRRVVKPAGFTPNIGDGYVDHWLAQRVDFDVAGRVTSKTSGADLPELLVGGGSVESYSYSARGAVQRIDSSYGLLIDHIAYEADGQPSLIRYGDLAQTETSFSYDVRRRLQFMDTHRSSPQLWSTGPFTAAYPQPTWRTTQTSLANVELRYDGVGNPTEIFDYADPDQYRHDDKLPVYRRGMQYDDLYRVTRVDYHYNAAANPVGFRSPYLPEVNAGDTRPVPLQLQLLTRVAQQSFDYDFLGNTTSTSDDLGASYDRSLGPVTHGASTDGPNQLRGANGIEASYDAAGNITELRVQRQGDCISGGVNKCAQWFAYDWDEVGQLAKARRWDFDTLPVVAPGEADAPAWSLTYAYSLGARVLKSSKDAAGERHTLEVFDTLRFERAPFVEQDEDYDRHRDNVQLYLGGGVGHVIYDSNYELPNLGSPIHRFINIGDHLGSASVTIDGDTSELVERATHEAFGAIESDYRPDRWNNAREPYKFTGKEEDIEVGLTYFGFRYYQPYLGRWASADPLTIHGLGSDLNPYAYVGGRVMNSVDPFGLEPASPGTKDIVQYGNGTWSGTAADGSVEVGKGDPFEKAAAAQSSERGWSGEIDHAVNAWSLDPTGAMGTHVPIGGGNYVTPAEVHNAVQNVARDIVVDGLDPLRLHHVVRGFTGWDPTARLKIRPKSNDPRNKSGIVGTVLGVAGSVAVGGFAEGAEVAGPRVYSVAFQTAIPKLGAGTRPAHFAAANEALLQEMRSSPQMAAAMEELGVQVPTNASGAAKGLSPQGWTWHHVPNQPGVLQLVPRAQHTAGSPFYMLMHPDGRGGFFNWGAAY